MTRFLGTLTDRYSFFAGAGEDDTFEPLVVKVAVVAWAKVATPGPR